MSAAAVSGQINRRVGTVENALAGQGVATGVYARGLAVSDCSGGIRAAGQPSGAACAALFPRCDGNAGDYRLPAAGDARRYRGHTRRGGVTERDADLAGQGLD